MEDEEDKWGDLFEDGIDEKIKEEDRADRGTSVED